MNWNFFKTNWFAIAMGFLLVFSALRKYPEFNPFYSPKKSTLIEKITGSEPKPQAGASLLGFVGESSGKFESKASEIEASQAEAFLKRFAHVAVSEKKKFGIPASVILACAFANSEAGRNEMASSANNFFALPCGEGWEGESANIGGKCARKYETAWASFRDFSIFLISQEWSGSLKKSAGKDWRKWVEKMGNEGLGNPKAMKKVIEAYKLNELD